MADPPKAVKTYKLYEYDKTDPAPYRVIVQLIDDKSGSVQLNKLTFGKLMTKTEEYKKNISNIRALGKFKAMVFMESHQAANQLQKDPQLKANNYKAYIPRSFVSVSGVVAGVPTDMTIEEIQENITCTSPILSINRLHRYEDGNKIPTNRVGITFRASVLPKEVRLFCCINSVRPFVNRPVLCLNCLRYNHATENCRSKKRCPNCSAMHDEMELGECQYPKKCFYCKTDHRTSDASCPERTRQRNIKNLMAKTTLTYMEVKEQNPVLTQNRYDILTNGEEFPSLPQTYSSMTAGEFRAKPEYRYKPQRAKRPIEEDVILADQVQVFADKKKKQSGEPSNNGVALFNKFRVTDFDRWAQLNEAARSKEILTQLSTRADGCEKVADGTAKPTPTMVRNSGSKAASINRSRSRSRVRDNTDE